MSLPQPDRFPPEWLAAYADRELPPEQCAVVERWLRENAEARESLEIQELLGPRNAELWETVTPPPPSSGQWQAAVSRVAGHNRIGVRKASYGWVVSLALAASVAGLLLLLPRQPAVVPPPPEEPHHEIARQAMPAVAIDDGPVEVASGSDVQILSLPEQAADLILVGDHPLRDSRLELATTSEIEFLGVGSDLAGRFPERPAIGKVNEVPIIWAPRGP